MYCRFIHFNKRDKDVQEDNSQNNDAMMENSVDNLENLDNK